MKIVMLEPLGVSQARVQEAAKDLIAAGHEIVYCSEPIPTVNEKINKAEGAEALIIANSPLEEEVIAALPDLKAISVGFTGIDHLPVNLCRERGIRIFNAQGYATDATAELALAMILASLRNIVAYDEKARHGGTKVGFENHTLTGKTVGIIGTGSIGLRLAELLQPFKCELLGYSRSEKEEAKELGITYLPLEELLKKSDIVSLHLPLTDETKDLIGADEIALMPENSVLINCARGAIIESGALATALENGNIAKAGIDVLEMEPPFPQDHPLLNAVNTTFTPHVGFFTKEALELRIDIVMDNLVHWLEGDPINVKL